MAGAETVKVIVRCRPINKREKDLQCETVIKMDRGVTCAIISPAERETPPKTFTFDGAYFTDSTTEQIYSDLGFNLVESVVEGYNGTVFAYGQTGCGKSFTMQGISSPPSQRGIIPRAFEHIFEVIQVSEDMKFLVYASYLEIYNEQIRDLLSEDTKKKLDLKESPDKGVYVSALTSHPVHNTAECEELMQKGWSNRATGATLMNADSSRSHSVFTINLGIIDTDNADRMRSGKLNLVDLAGSERQSKTKAEGDRLKEATKINLSLSALGNVISALVDGKSKHIPYRDSKLTRLLQDSLGGNTKTLMIACISPADNNYDETLSTLRYANRAKNIKNKPKINEDPKDAMLREYQHEIQKLREMLEKQGPNEIGHSSAIIETGPSEEALEEEREKVRLEYEEQMRKMKEDMLAERENNVILQANMENLKKKYEDELETVNKKIEQRSISRRSGVNVNIDAMGRDGALVLDAGVDAQGRNTPLGGVAKMRNAEMMTSMQQEALLRLKEMQQQMVGGEKAHDKELKAKRKKRKKVTEDRMKMLSEALKNVDDDDGVMMKFYDDINEELKVKTDLVKKMKQKVKSRDQEISDLSAEFEKERSDYLDTIRKQDQQVKLLQAILEKVQPTIRKDCNYCDLDAIKKEAYWDDEYSRWKIPKLNVVKTKLPPAGPTAVPNDLISRYNQFTGSGSNLSTTANNNNNNYNNGVNAKLQPGGRNPSQTAPARLGIWEEDSRGDKFLQSSTQPPLQKLQRAEDENIAGSYFKPKKRANELLVRFQPDPGISPQLERSKKLSNSGNLNTSLGPSMLGNTFNFNTSFNNSQGSSYNSSWGSSSSSSNGGVLPTFGGSGGALNTLGSNVISNGWLGGNNGLSSTQDKLLRKPNRLEALPGDRRNKKDSRDVLNTLDLI